MAEQDFLAKRFDDSRAHLRAVALRMLGSATEADDAVQEAWLKVSRAHSSDVENLGGWLTTVVARVCLDMLRARKSQREEALASTDADLSDAVALEAATPESRLGLADAIGPALLVVLDALAPAERVAFVLHDLFDLSFEEIAPIVERTPDAARQLASRARRRVRGGEPVLTDSDHLELEPQRELARRRELVAAFLAASREGDFAGLLAVLAPRVVLRADEVALRAAAANPGGAPKLAPEVAGAQLVADAFKGRARGALPALIGGQPGAVWATGGQVRVAFIFSIEAGAITAIDLVMDPDQLAKLDIQLG